jgi:urease accessory protein
MNKNLLLLLSLLGFPMAALAHPGHEMANLFSGFSHPFTGVDHLLVMLAVGFWAGQSRAQARWQLPLLFIMFMLGGVLLGATISSLPMVEIAIAISVLAMGVVILINTAINRIWQFSLTILFALLHGFVHGQELVTAGSGMAAIAGMSVAAMVLLGMGLLLASYKSQAGLYLQRAMVAVLTLSGTYLLMM